MTPLDGLRVVTIAINLPGPRACQRLMELGATVTKIEPTAGDPVAKSFPELYRELHRNQKILALDLKSAAGKASLKDLLRDTDLFLTASRPSALARLDLAWTDLHARYPQLCCIRMVGFPAPDENRPGHDLMYQAAAGLLKPPRLPRVLLADYAGSEQAVSTALALLLARERTGDAAMATVSLTDAITALADPIRLGITVSGGPLGGGSPLYGLYQTRSGWIALAALEDVFIKNLKTALDITEINRKRLDKVFLTGTAREWEEWGRKNDIPVAVVTELET